MTDIHIESHPEQTQIPVQHREIQEMDQAPFNGIERPAELPVDNENNVFSLDAQRRISSAKKIGDVLLFKDAQAVAAEPSSEQGMPRLRQEVELLDRGIGGTRTHTGTHSKYGHGPSYSDIKHMARVKQEKGNPLPQVAKQLKRRGDLRRRWL